MNDPLYRLLLEYFARLGSAAVAFSGGVDSTVVCVAAHEALGDKAVALTISAPYIPRREIDEAQRFAQKRGLRHHIIPFDLPDAIRNNPRDRYYRCKSLLFTRLKAAADDCGCAGLCDGTNADDLLDDRPGLRALRELSIRSPLAELAIGKEQVRRIAKELELETWSKPSSPCLLTRIPYDHPVDAAELMRIERAEQFLREKGFDAVRVRSHQGLARIEITPGLREGLLEERTASEIYRAFREFGFTYVTLDLLGYRSGSFNEEP
jgi:uncharacterized protein